MKVDNPLRDKSYAFALKISRLCLGIQKQQKEFVLSKQLLRSSTSIGSNVEESIGGHSKKDFYYRITVAYREARESHYWIRLLTDLDFIDKDESEALLADAEEILKLSGSIKRTLQKQIEVES
ncbi:MAG: four helix bundle protein [Flavobacteriales bacterium]|nr:four helix bundle protein [Flavobacteriales bacterium]|tara:strand:+ start:32390 stop:32758 length:369 start_codon:yes stop_codon:yes gene_type:complete